MRAQRPYDRAVFIDTTAFYGFMDRRDQWHKPARAGFFQLASEERELYATNLILAETHALLLRRLGHTIAHNWLQALQEIHVVFQTESHHSQAVSLLTSYADHGYSYADSFSFVVMRELGISTAVAFDRHFLAHGFQLLS